MLLLSNRSINMDVWSKMLDSSENLRYFSELLWRSYRILTEWQKVIYPGECDILEIERIQNLRHFKAKPTKQNQQKTWKNE